MAEIKDMIGEYLCKLSIHVDSPIVSNPDPVVSEAELRQRDEDPLATRVWEITSPHDESDPAALILELESDQTPSRNNSRLVVEEGVQGPEQVAPRFELVLSDEQNTETFSDVKERRNQRRRKRRRELKQQRLQKAFASATSRTPTVSASSQ